jgi:hypothetical protein
MLVHITDVLIAVFWPIKLYVMTCSESKRNQEMNTTKIS